MDASEKAAPLTFDLTTALRNLAVGWRLKAEEIRAAAEARYKSWQAQAPDTPTGTEAGLLAIARDEKAYQEDVAAFFDRAAARALGELPALLVTGDPRVMRHTVYQDVFNNLTVIYQAAEAQGRILTDNPPPPPATPDPVPFRESRDAMLARQDYEAQLRRAVEDVRSYGIDGVELSATLARDPEAMAKINAAQTDFARQLRTRGQ